MKTKTEIATVASAVATIAFAALPAVLSPLADGTFAGIATRADGVHCAVVLISVAPTDKCYSYNEAKAYAESVGGQRPPKAVWSLLYETCRDLIPKYWYWVDEPEGSSCAWLCYFAYGDIYFHLYRSSEGGAVAVRLIPLTT